MNTTVRPYGAPYESEVPLEADRSATPLARPIAPGAEPGRAVSVLGPTLTFRGELTAGEDLLIEGRVQGSIDHKGQNLTVGEQGFVKASVHACRIVIKGRVEGDLTGSEAVIVEPTANVRGNLYAPRVALTEGAKFNGSIDMDAPAAARSSSAVEAESRRAQRKKNDASRTSED
jgi:cytoskeletal protein CcmA (bactofilin family)